jgi:uncharacterized metal-binding protein
MKKEKIAISSCTGMSPYGLVGRAACSDIVNESENTISICITATSAESGGYKNLIKKYPIIAVNGCNNECVNRILQQKGVKTAKTLNIMKLLDEEGMIPSDAARLSEEDEKCVEVVKNKIRIILDLDK